VAFAELLRVHSVPSFQSSMKTLNRTGPSIDPWGTPLVTGLQLHCTTDDPLCLFRQFSVYLTVFSFLTYFIRFSMRILWKFSGNFSLVEVYWVRLIKQDYDLVHLQIVVCVILT